jgi:hypothetical protein
MLSNGGNRILREDVEEDGWSGKNSEECIGRSA